MRFTLSHIATAVVSCVSLAHATTTADLRSFLKAHPGTKGISSASSEFVDWSKQDAFTTNSTEAPVVPKAYIVQLKPGTDLTKRGEENAYASFHKRAAEDIDYTTRQEFKNSDLFFGLSIQVKDESDKAKIADIPNVLRVWPVREIARPEPRAGKLPTAVSTPEVARLAGPIAQAGPKANINSIHRQTEVDRLHALGIKGKGIKIAIMDTGIDYYHEALGGGFGPGYKVAFGKDFWDGDDDPLAACVAGGHGTHVAGTIGMQDPESSPFGLVGVAPEATLGMYRVFGCGGGAPSDLILAAFEQAAIDKVDIISVSLGSYLEWELEDPFSIITASLEAQGIAVVVANGNNGLYAGIPSSPSVGKGVIAVGSTQNSHFPAVYGFKDSRGRSLKYSGDPWPVTAPATGLTVYDFTKLAANTTSPNGCSYDAWWAADDAVPDKANSIIILPQTDCRWASKIITAQGLGFRYTLIYSKDEDDIFDKEYNVLDPFPGYYGITVNAVDGKTILGGLAASKPGEYKLFFTSTEFESHTQLTAGAVSNFSSWGPTLDTLAIKPQISAPGGSILSTWPLEATGYAILSGTSMATPYVSGALALVKSQFPKASVQELRERLQSTAQLVKYIYNKDLTTSVAQQGGGQINVYNAIFLESRVSPSELNLGDTDALKPQEIKIENKSSRSKTYVITHEPAGEANSLPYTYDHSAPGLTGQYASYATVQFSTTSVTIPAGQSATVIATFTPPQDISERYLPIYSGFIRVTNNNDQFKVPYLGQPYSRHDAQYIDTSNKTGEQLPRVIKFREDNSIETINGIGTFDFGATAPGESYPYLDFLFLQSHKYWRVDILPYNTTFKPDYYGFTSSPSNPYGVPESALPLVYPNLKLNSTFAGAETFGTWEEDIESRRPAWFLWYLDKYILGPDKVPVAPLPTGDYRALLRVLRWGGDATKEEEYQSWLSPVIRLVAGNATTAAKSVPRSMKEGRKRFHL